MKIKTIEAFRITLPFRFSFGHNLARRAVSTNVIVRVTLENGIQGYGEGVPRDYVTGEDACGALHQIQTVYAPALIGADVCETPKVVPALEELFADTGLNREGRGASWCAIELAVLDAVAKLHHLRVAELFGPIVTPKVRYGGVIPFGNTKAVAAMLCFYKLYGFQTVKVKVGKTLEIDRRNVAMARRIMGANAIIRVDANCAWTLDQALQAAEAFAPYSVASYEQPLAPSDWRDSKRFKAQLPAAVQVVADESLCTAEQAEFLAQEGIFSAFNIRISKVGGFLAAQRIIKTAEKYGIKCHLGAQVGETGILSAAAAISPLSTSALRIARAQ